MSFIERCPLFGVSFIRGSTVYTGLALLREEATMYMYKHIVKMTSVL